MNDLSTSLWITALGMGLVFGAILVLWLMMVLLTSLTADKEPASSLDASTPLSTGIEPASVIEADFKSQAAAIAVAMALAEQQTSTARALPEPPTVIVSAWQLGMRSRLLAEKGHTRRR